MASIRKLKRAQSKKIKVLLLGFSIDADGNVDIWLPGRRKALRLTRIELGLIQALPVSLDPQPPTCL